MNYTLTLFDQVLASIPAGLPEDVVARAREARQGFIEETPEEDIEQAMIAYGREAWPYEQAMIAFSEQQAAEVYDGFLHEALSEALAAKWQAFIAGGGSLHDYMHTQQFEEAFTPEENVALEQAMTAAKKQLESYVMKQATGEQKEAYQKLVERYIKEREAIEQAMKQLEKLKDTGEKWDQEIDADMYHMKKGFAQLEERPSAEKAQGRVDFYQGQIETGNA